MPRPSRRDEPLRRKVFAQVFDLGAGQGRALSSSGRLSSAGDGPVHTAACHHIHRPLERDLLVRAVKVFGELAEKSNALSSTRRSRSDGPDPLVTHPKTPRLELLNMADLRKLRR